MKLIRQFIFLICIIFHLQAAQAKDVYEVTVSREAQDLYEITNGDGYIKTRYCYEYVYYDDAILIIDSWYGYTLGKIIFDSGSSCEIEKILR